MQCMVTEHPLAQPVQAKGAGLTTLSAKWLLGLKYETGLHNHHRRLLGRETKHSPSSFNYFIS